MKKLTTFLFSKTTFLANSMRPSLRFAPQKFTISKIFLFIFFHSFLQLQAQDSTKVRELNEVIVSSTRANLKTGMAFTNVYQKELKKQNLGQDMPFLLNQLPSVVVSSDAGAGVGYTGIRIRGTDPTRINVTLNGVPYNDSESQGTYWVNMPDFASSTQSIQVQRGVGTSTNGAGAFGASININTLTYEKDAFGETNISIGSFNTKKINVLASTGLLANSSGKGSFVVDARLSKLMSDGYIDRASSDLKSFYLSGGYYNKNNFVRLNVFSGKEKTYQAWEGVPENLLKTDRTFNSYTYDNQVDDYQQDHYQLISSFKLNSSWTFNPTLHYTKGHGFYEQFKEQDKYSNYGLPNVVINNVEIKKTDLIRRKWLDNDFYGITYSFDYQSNKKLSANIGGAWNKYDGDHFGEIIWAKNTSTANIRYRWYESNALKSDFNVFTKAYYQLTEALNFYGDLQYRTVAYDIKGTGDKRQNITQTTAGGVPHYQFFNPKFGLNYQLDKNASAYISFAVGNKEPSRQDFIDNAPKAPLAENLKDVEAGYRLAGKTFNVDANVYYMDYKNQLVLTGQVNGVGEAIRVNVPKSYRAGLELVAAWQIANQWKLGANATFSQNKIKNFSETVINYDGDADKINNFQKTDISFSPNIIAGGQLSYSPSKNIELTWLSKYVGRQYLDNTANINRSLNAFFVNDMRATYSVKLKLVKELTFSLLVNNIFNHLYEANGYTYSYIYDKQTVTENFYYPQAGTNFLLAMKVRL